MNIAFQSDKSNRIVIPGVCTLQIGSYTDVNQKQVFVIYLEDYSQKTAKVVGDEEREFNQRIPLARKNTFAEAQETMQQIAADMREAMTVVKVK